MGKQRPGGVETSSLFSCAGDVEEGLTTSPSAGGGRQAGRQAGGLLNDTNAHTLFSVREPRPAEKSCWKLAEGARKHSLEVPEFRLEPSRTVFLHDTEMLTEEQRVTDGTAVRGEGGDLQNSSDLFPPERTVPVRLLGWDFVWVVTIFPGENCHLLGLSTVGRSKSDNFDVPFLDFLAGSGIRTAKKRDETLPERLHGGSRFGHDTRHGRRWPIRVGFVFLPFFACLYYALSMPHTSY